MKTLQIIGWVLLGLFVLLFISLLTARIYLNWQAGKKPEHSQFTAGTVPTKLPNGSYDGQASSPGNWLGKTFMPSTATGLNRFRDGDRYHFHMYFGSSLTNPQKQVLKIDYNEAGNPWWLRFVVDEVVQTGPNRLLGKIQINTFPHLAFTVGYFSLQN